MSLKTDYKDDILAVGNLRKYQMIQNNDGTVSFQDVTQYEQTGDVFGAGDINRTNQAVNEKFDSGDVVDPMLTTELGFAADAYQTKLQFDAQNKKTSDGLRGYTNPIVIAYKNDLTPMEQNGAYLLADSEEGRNVLNQYAEYVSTTTIEGNFYRMAGADTVFPFKKNDIMSCVIPSGSYLKIGWGRTPMIETYSDAVSLQSNKDAVIINVTDRNFTQVKHTGGSADYIVINKNGTYDIKNDSSVNSPISLNADVAFLIINGNMSNSTTYKVTLS